MQDEINFEELISRYLFQELTDEEKRLLNEWLDKDESNRLLFEKLTNEKYITSALKRMEYYDEEKGWFKFKAAMGFSEERNPEKKWLWWAAAASILLLGSLTYYFFQKRFSDPLNDYTVMRVVENIKAPDKNIATIKLGDGTILSLDSLNANIPLVQHSVQMIKHDDGHISYRGSAIRQENNTIVNPRGSRVVQIELSDGTRIWLNAGSSVTYPVAFMDDERIISVDGEIYLEVAKDILHPFIVKKNDVEVKVLGTSFDVNAYDGEKNIRVTLLTGRVALKNSFATAELLPGQQGIVGNNIIVDKEVNTEAVMSWKNGLFYFHQASLTELVKQIERWYNVDITIAPGVSDRVFGGKIRRDASLVSVLKIMDESNIHYSITDNKITIVP